MERLGWVTHFVRSSTVRPPLSPTRSGVAPDGVGSAGHLVEAHGAVVGDDPPILDGTGRVRMGLG